MFFSLFLILLGGFAAGLLFKKLRLPALLGMLLLGILFSDHCLHWIDPRLMEISPDLRQIALLIILLRAGLDLNVKDLKKVGRPAILMCFLPATFEIIGCLLLGQTLLHLSWQESLLLGSVLAAVSPAVVVPGMLKLIQEKRGTAQGVPQLILAGASGDDIYCLVLFACFTTLVASGTFDFMTLWRIPTSIVFGLLGGWIVGQLVSWLFARTALETYAQIIVVMGLSFLLIGIEKQMTGIIGFSGLLGIIACAMVVAARLPAASRELSRTLNLLWQCAQIFLFVLVGAAVDLSALANAGLLYFLVIAGAMVFRMAGVFASVAGSSLSFQEQMFCMFAYTPKATVQAAIGAVPLSMGLACGNTVLSMAVLAILVTAPLGAILIDKLSGRLLHIEEDPQSTPTVHGSTPTAG